MIRIRTGLDPTNILGPAVAVSRIAFVSTAAFLLIGCAANVKVIDRQPYDVRAPDGFSSRYVDFPGVFFVVDVSNSEITPEEFVSSLHMRRRINGNLDKTFDEEIAKKPVLEAISQLDIAANSNVASTLRASGSYTRKALVRVFKTREMSAIPSDDEFRKVRHAANEMCQSLLSVGQDRYAFYVRGIEVRYVQIEEVEETSAFLGALNSNAVTSAGIGYFTKTGVKAWVIGWSYTASNETPACRAAHERASAHPASGYRPGNSLYQLVSRRTGNDQMLVQSDQNRKGGSTLELTQYDRPTSTGGLPLPLKDRSITWSSPLPVQNSLLPAQNEGEHDSVEARIRRDVERIPDLSSKTKSIIIQELLPITRTNQLVRLVELQNAKLLPLSIIKETDRMWVAGNTDLPLMKELITNSCAQETIKLRKRYAFIMKAFVTDNQGALVCASAPTPDYWQGNKAIWLESYNAGLGGVSIARAMSDSSPEGKVLQVSLPIVAASGKPVGAVTFELSVDDK